MQLWQFQGGVHPHDKKSLACDISITQASIPPFITLPLSQHIGSPAIPLVQVGDKVLKGQVIAGCKTGSCNAPLSAPIHASTSGTVVAIEPRPVPHPSTLKAPCIVIETDGEDKWIPLEPIKDYRTVDPEVIRQRIAQSGIVGLGGAGFPTHIKLAAKGIETLIINAAECEPYITCDDRLMREHPDQIIEGIKILSHVLGNSVKRRIIAIEDNKHTASAILKESVKGQDVEVIQVPTRYPMGGERQLMYVLLGKEVARAKLPSDIGVVMQNVETTRAVYKAVVEGKPLVSRTVTVTGTGVKTPKNLEVLIGTPMHILIDQCGRKENIERLVLGGPMMGFALPNDELPTVKTSNCLILSTADELLRRSKPLPCIRCGSCSEVCPMHLLPQLMYWYAKAKDFKRVEEYSIFDCIECGCCAYVCPSYIPLVDYYRHAKSEITVATQEQKKSDIARQRHEFRVERLEREKAERAALMKSKQDSALAKSVADAAAKKAEIDAAVARVESQKANNSTTSNSSEQ
jgi:electron transport complex protein RnfC